MARPISITKDKILAAALNIVRKGGPSMPTGTFKGYIDTFVGFKEECLAAIGTSFGLRGSDAEQLYYQMILRALGLAHTCTRGGSTLSIHDSEWADLERVFRNTFNLTPLHNIFAYLKNSVGVIPVTFLNSRLKWCGYSNPSKSATSPTLSPFIRKVLAWSMTKV